MIKKFAGMYLLHKVQLQISNSKGSYFLLCFLFIFVSTSFVGCALFDPKSSVNKINIIEPGGIVPSVNFELVGRVSAKGKNKGFSGGVRWSHIGTDDNIHLLSPFGQIVAQIKSDSDTVILTTSEQKIFRSKNVESLTKQVLGWQLPLLGLQYWVRGVNAPSTRSEVVTDKNGRIIGINQDGWKITYTSFSPTSKLIQTARPKALVLNRNNLKIKLVIDNWNTK